MILDIHEKFEVSPEWFEEQVKRSNGWEKRLCELLSIYKLKDLEGAMKAAEKMKAAGVNELLIKEAMD